MPQCYYATQNGDGSLGAWTTSATAIPNSGAGNAQMDSFGRGILGVGDTVYISRRGQLRHNQNTCYNSNSLREDTAHGSRTIPRRRTRRGSCRLRISMSAAYLYRVAGTYRASMRATCTLDAQLRRSLGPFWVKQAQSLPAVVMNTVCAWPTVVHCDRRFGSATPKTPWYFTRSIRPRHDSPWIGAPTYPTPPVERAVSYQAAASRTSSASRRSVFRAPAKRAVLLCTLDNDTDGDDFGDRTTTARPTTTRIRPIGS